ncbi:speedy protein A isoform X1 [Hydra vulgaris]|uniref:speedy protein A isoform X1 n=1 Tax=Hydra vulgaris TaxID=6087 RepID=UPI001F5EEB84|nr:speedy protein A isoform X3 [Hydra vulgaris]
MGSNISLFEIKKHKEESVEKGSMSTQKDASKIKKCTSNENLVYTPESYPILPKRSRKSLSFPEEISQPELKKEKFSCRITPDKGSLLAAFFKVFDDDVVQDFLWMDKCYTLSDKYLLAMVYTYFRRAKLNKREYTRMNFFVALYLAHDVEEDNEDLKLEIYPWALGLHWKRRHLHFISQRDALLKRMKFRAIVSKLTCDEVILLCPSHPIWKRERKSHHGGAVRIYPDEESENFSPVGPNGVQPFCMLCATWVPPSPTLTSGYLSSSCILDFSSVDNSSNNYFQHLLLDETNSNSDTNFGQ